VIRGARLLHGICAKTVVAHVVTVITVDTVAVHPPKQILPSFGGGVLWRRCFLFSRGHFCGGAGLEPRHGGVVPPFLGDVLARRDEQLRARAVRGHERVPEAGHFVTAGRDVAVVHLLSIQEREVLPQPVLLFETEVAGVFDGGLPGLFRFLPVHVPSHLRETVQYKISVQKISVRNISTARTISLQYISTVRMISVRNISTNNFSY
jgi:hypothetical protein